MSTITVLPDATGASNGGFCAVAGTVQSTGQTFGQALDALTAKIGAPTEATLVVLLPQLKDDLFPQAQQNRLTELMNRWRAARDSGTVLSSDEQSELDALSEAEVRASGERAAEMLRQLAS